MELICIEPKLYIQRNGSKRKKMRDKENFLDVIKVIYEKPTANVIFNG